VVDQHDARRATTGDPRAQHRAPDLQSRDEPLDLPVGALAERARDVAPPGGHPDPRHPDRHAALDPHERVAGRQQVGAVGEHVDPQAGRLRLGGGGGQQEEQAEGHREQSHR
jgi:hypothetical protein